jgi:hypothetical protein
MMESVRGTTSHLVLDTEPHPVPGRHAIHPSIHHQPQLGCEIQNHCASGKVLMNGLLKRVPYLLELLLEDAVT